MIQGFWRNGFSDGGGKAGATWSLGRVAVGWDLFVTGVEPAVAGSVVVGLLQAQV